MNHKRIHNAITILEIAIAVLVYGCAMPTALQSPSSVVPVSSIPTLLLSTLTGSATAANVVGLPNARLTPGSTDPRVSQANIQSTICRRGGYTSSVRPPVSYTEPLKFSGIKLYGYSDKKVSDYEEDHLIPLEIGGNPTDPKNLWPEPHHIGNWGAYVTDNLENKLHDLVCSGRLSLGTAQQAIATDWVAAYKKYIGGN